MIKQLIFFSYFVILLNCFYFIKTEECEIKDEDGKPIPWGSYKLKAINDTDYGVVATFDTTNIDRIDQINSDYLDATFDKAQQMLSIKTTDAYKNYEETNIYDTITISINFLCTGSIEKKNIRFMQTLIDVNTHSPKFPKEIYEYKLPMPWPKSLDITLLEQIVVKDIDFSNRNIKFEIDENEYVEIVENPSIDNAYKQYPATLRPKRSLNLVDDLTLKIYATDNKDIYGQQHHEEATVKILIDEEGSVPSAPRFEKLLYEGKYHKTDTIELEEISIEKETYTESIQIDIIGKYSENFKIKHVKDNFYELEVKDNLPSIVWETETYISLELQIKNELTGSSVILTLDAEKSLVPIFEKRLYEGIYLDTDQIDMENIVIVKDTYVESVDIEINGKYSENFNVMHIKDNTYQLEVIKPLPSTIWELEKYVSLALEIKGEDTGTAIVLTSDVENSPKPRFEKHTYEGKYLDNDQIDLEDLVIVEETYVESINIEVNGKYSKNFRVTHVKDNKFQLEVEEPLPSAVLESETYVSLILEIQGGLTATTVVLEIENKEMQPIPRFEKLVYEGKYNDDDKIDLEDLIIVKETYAESIDIGISGKYSENFNVMQIKDNTYQLEVIKPLPSTIWELEKYVSLALEIKGEDTGTAIVLTSDVENSPKPRFEKHTYEGKYLDNDQIDLEDLVIVEETYVESINIEVNGKYSKNFRVTHVKDNKFQLKVEEPLPSAVLESETYVSLILEIQGGLTATTVVLEIENKEMQPIPRFEKLVYEGKYDDDDKLDLEDLIIVKETYAESIDIGISGKYSENFRVMHVKDNKYQLEVEKPLSSAVLESENYVSLILEIEGEFTGTAVVLTIESSKADTPIPRFEKLVYEGKYYDDEKLDLEDLVIVKETYVESIDIGISGKYSENFRVQHVTDNQYRLEITKPLQSTVWELEKYVSLTLEIKEKNTGTTIVLTSGVKKFEKLVYQGKYYDNDKMDLEDLILDEETLTEPMDIDLTGKYSENFIVKQLENNKYQLKIEKPLPTSVWDSEEYISLKLNIKEVYTGTTVALTLEKINISEDCKLPLSFLEPLEIFVIISTNFYGEISSKRAVDFPKSKIEYSAENKPEFVEIDKATGDVTIKKDVDIQQGTYEFKIIAENILKEKDTYKITLWVRHESITSKNALSVKTIPENEQKKDFIELDTIDKKQNCKFEIKNTEPKGDWFVVNEKSGNIDVKAINRTDKLFVDMYLKEVQVHLTLNVDCRNEDAEIKFIELFNSSVYGKSVNAQIFILNNELKNQQNILSFNYSKREDKEDPKYQWIYTNEISHETEQMIVNVRVDNTENHPPSFVDVSPLHIGYPSMELIEVIHPQFVYQVHAIDEDIGLNGTISYKFESKSESSYFIIHKNTGVIYPSKKLSTSIDSTKIDLEVFAEDRDGDGLSSKSLSITVHILDMKQISVMKIEKGLIENLSDILEKISEKTEWSVQQLTSAVIPEATEHDVSRFFAKLAHRVTRFLADDNLDTLLTVYTYAFDNDYNIISADDFVEKLKNIDFEGVDWTVDSVEPHSNNITSVIIKEEQSKGLLVAVIIVSIAFVCYVVGSIFYFTSRNRKNHNPVYTTKPSDQVEHDSSNVIPRLSMIINDNLIGSSNSDGDESTRNTLRVINTLRERKKSNVTFNDEVEQIEIKDPETHQSNSLH
ncbi:uncharacterized protein LOC123305627 isoform X1 [Chrysoperla carnea]|uniref:uncharacterized protein LOC123305627 isoform X1 n=1 Tax=Chrysoperla carnea TaxID=189513 RepID=UPI001D087DC5|nr:uncharacterized protein LOC123305627 isoform X1 [Chrysoperla carnea]